MAVDGVSTIKIQCILGRGRTKPFWIINGSVYELFSIPYSFLPEVTPPVIPVADNYSSLIIPLATADLNGVTFQCAIFHENGAIFGNITKITVTPGEQGNISLQACSWAENLHTKCIIMVNHVCNTTVVGQK